MRPNGRGQGLVEDKTVFSLYNTILAGSLSNAADETESSAACQRMKNALQ